MSSPAKGVAAPRRRRVVLASAITAEDGPHQPGESIVVDWAFAEKLHGWGMLAAPPEDVPDEEAAPPPKPPQGGPDVKGAPSAPATPPADKEPLPPAPKKGRAAKKG